MISKFYQHNFIVTESVTLSTDSEHAEAPSAIWRFWKWLTSETELNTSEGDIMRKVYNNGTHAEKSNQSSTLPGEATAKSTHPSETRHITLLVKLLNRETGLPNMLLDKSFWVDVGVDIYRRILRERSLRRNERRPKRDLNTRRISALVRQLRSRLRHMNSEQLLSFFATYLTAKVENGKIVLNGRTYDIQRLSSHCCPY